MSKIACVMLGSCGGGWREFCFYNGEEFGVYCMYTKYEFLLVVFEYFERVWGI